jgi:hypothetical protein
VKLKELLAVEPMGARTTDQIKVVETSAANMREVLNLLDYSKQVHDMFTKICDEIDCFYKKCKPTKLSIEQWNELQSDWEDPKSELVQHSNQLQIQIWSVLDEIWQEPKNAQKEKDLTYIQMKSAAEDMLRIRNTWPEAYERCSLCIKKKHSVENIQEAMVALKTLLSESLTMLKDANQLMIGQIKFLTKG